MGFRGGVDQVALVDEDGREVVDPFVPLDTEFWNGDRMRYTLFLDPGRVKRGILPNQEMGRALVPGRRYTSPGDYKAAIERADGWLRNLKPVNTPDADAFEPRLSSL